MELITFSLQLMGGEPDCPNVFSSTLQHEHSAWNRIYLMIYRIFSLLYLCLSHFSSRWPLPTNCSNLSSKITKFISFRKPLSCLTHSALYIPTFSQNMSWEQPLEVPVLYWTTTKNKTDFLTLKLTCLRNGCSTQVAEIQVQWVYVEINMGTMISRK